MQGLKNFTQISIDFIEHSIKANQREDQLFHAYNLMSVENNGISISYLPEMLEGQVAILSSGILSAKQSIKVLDALRNSDLYRKDQNSYILYPNKELPKFLEKNTIPKESVEKSALLKHLLSQSNNQLINKDIKGNYHFNGNFHNANDLKIALEQLACNTDYKDLVKKDTALILQFFEEVFNHKAFTGRSGTFYGYEGLGSIYWHMVSKLHLAVLEVINKAIDANEDQSTINILVHHFDEIGAGIGIHKSPKVYGAFPTDPYSHTPFGKGAQQPGMTGQVKEDVLVRIGEFGVKMNDGKLHFKPTFLKKEAFLSNDTEASFIMVDGLKKQLHLKKNSLAFTTCQIPVIYKMNTASKIVLNFKNGDTKTFESLELNKEETKKIVQRTNEISVIEVSLNESILR